MRLLTLERDGSTAIVTLDWPEKRNALSLELMHALLETLSIIDADPDVRVVILTAAGPVFSSGHDLSEMTSGDEQACRTLFDVCTGLMLKLQSLRQPVVAEVQGLATAAGCQLVAACDLAIAAKDAGFATPGVRIGIFCTTPMVPLVRAVGRKRAMHMLLTGEVIDARTAEEWGLVNKVVANGELRKTTLALARKIAEASPETLAVGKRAFYEQVDLPERQVYDKAKCVMTSSALSPEAHEGISAFLEKRKPAWPRR